ncbi:MAG: CcmD family protein [candidate division Zixibacteria bacterium]|jgi:CcmD family protein|nr:CcmD family protein [candidate division Zixibacteria bacterium]
MITLAPLAVSMIIWVGLWLYLLKLDRKIKELEKNAKKI